MASETTLVNISISWKGFNKPPHINNYQASLPVSVIEDDILIAEWLFSEFIYSTSQVAEEGKNPVLVEIEDADTGEIYFSKFIAADLVLAEYSRDWRDIDPSLLNEARKILRTSTD